jgi:CHAT domain-containing protein
MVEHEVSYLPSASTLAVLRQQARQRPPAPKTLTLFADPVFNTQDERFRSVQKPQTPPTIVAAGLPLARAAQSFGIEWDRLPGTQAEAQAITALIPEMQRRTALGFQASQTEVLQPELSQYRFIHFATHGLANTEKPELSAIVMSLLDEQGNAVDGFLRLQEVYNLDLRADLVVLSACQTGLGQVIRGEGLIGLTRGFMYAGAPRVVTSLWNVDDAGTAVLMTHFYEGILRENLPPSAALRQAQLKLWQTPQWQSPYYWAAFTLQGEWR